MKRKAFTLIELLIVIAIIGVLAGLLTPMISAAQKSALKTTSRTLLVNMATALESYKNEYGYYPDFLAKTDRVNLNDESNSENFIKALTGKNPDGSKLSAADRKLYNRKAIKFLEFNNQNLLNKKDKKTGTSKWYVLDSFANPNIYICVDNDNDGFINKGFPTIEDKIGTADLSELVPNAETGVRVKTMVFTLKKDSARADAEYSSEDVFSW